MLITQQAASSQQHCYSKICKPSCIHCFSFQVLGDDAHLMASSEDRSWSIWDLGQERVTRLFTADMGAVRGLAIAPDAL